MNRVPLLLQQNPNLRSLNLEFSEIESLDSLLEYLTEFTELEELNLFGNRLTTLPTDLSKLQKLKRLDINNNLFSSIDIILESLQTLPSLIDLQYALSSPEDEDKVLVALPALRKLNSKEIIQDNRHEITPVEFKANIEYTSEDLTLKQEELEKIAIIYDDLRSLWREIEPRGDKKLAEYFDTNIKSILQELSEINKQSLASHLLHCYTLKAKYSFYNICQDKAMQYIGRNSKKLESIFQEIHDSYSALFEEAISMIFALDKKYTGIVNSLKDQLEKSNKQTAEVLETAERLEKECEKHVQEKASLRTRFHQDRDEFVERIKDLTEENRRYLDMVVKNSKTFAESAMSYKKYSLPQQVKNLNLRQMHEIIEEIYESKTKLNKKCIAEKTPRETMEKHMYSYLNQKYGLKTVVVEWAAGIIAGIKKYAEHDNDVLVFAKILKNEVEEEFRFIQKRLKDTILENIKKIVAIKKPALNNLQIEDKIQNKLRGFLKKNQCREILCNLYGENDFKNLYATVCNALNPRDKIKFIEFEQLVLGYQQKIREKDLADYVDRFKSVDHDNDGVINLQQFKELVVLIQTGVNYNDAIRGMTSFTLSDCIGVMGKDLIKKALR